MTRAKLVLQARAEFSLDSPPPPVLLAAGQQQQLHALRRGGGGGVHQARPSRHMP